MTRQCGQQEGCVRVDQQPFDLWLATDLRERFGELEQLPEEWVALLDTTRLEE